MPILLRIFSLTFGIVARPVARAAVRAQRAPRASGWPGRMEHEEGLDFADGSQVERLKEVLLAKRSK